MTDYNQRVKDRIAQQRAKRRKNKREAVVYYTLAVLLMLALIAFIVVINGLLTLFAWNVGVAAVVAACGGTVGKITLLEAIGINFAWGVVTRLFRQPIEQRVKNAA